MKSKAVSILAIELVIAISAFIAVNILGEKFQPIISRQQGRPWEAAYYYKMAEDFSKGQRPAGPGPWISRIGTSFAASLLPGRNMMQNFLTVNIIANALVTLLFLAWLRLFITSWKVRVLLMLLFLLPFNSLARRVYYCPVAIDHWDKVFLLAGLIGIHKVGFWRMRWAILFLSAVSFVGAISRGVVLLVPLALLFVDNPVKFNRDDFKFGIIQWPRKILYVPLVFGVIGVLFCNKIVIYETSSYATMRLMGRVVYEMLVSTYVLGWFIAYGPILALIAYNWRSTLKFLMAHQYQFITVLAVLVLAWMGGNSVNRYAYWAFPTIYVLIGKAIEEHWREMRAPLFLAVLGTSQIIAQRVFMIWPDYPNAAPSKFPIFTPWGNDVRLLDVIGLGVSEANLIALAEYILFSVLVILYLYYRERSGRNMQCASGGMRAPS